MGGCDAQQGNEGHNFLLITAKSLHGSRKQQGFRQPRQDQAYVGAGFKQHNDQQYKWQYQSPVVSSGIRHAQHVATRGDTILQAMGRTAMLTSGQPTGISPKINPPNACQTDNGNAMPRNGMHALMMSNSLSGVAITQDNPYTSRHLYRCQSASNAASKQRLGQQVHLTNPSVSDPVNGSAEHRLTVASSTTTTNENASAITSCCETLEPSERASCPSNSSNNRDSMTLTAQVVKPSFDSADAACDMRDLQSNITTYYQHTDEPKSCSEPPDSRNGSADSSSNSEYNSSKRNDKGSTDCIKNATSNTSNQHGGIPTHKLSRSLPHRGRSASAPRPRIHVAASFSGHQTPSQGDLYGLTATSPVKGRNIAHGVLSMDISPISTAKHWHNKHPAAPSSSPQSSPVGMDAARQAQLRVEAFKHAKEQQAAKTLSDEAAVRQKAKAAAQKLVEEKELRRARIYALNTILARWDEAMAAKLLAEREQQDGSHVQDADNVLTAGQGV